MRNTFEDLISLLQKEYPNINIKATEDYCIFDIDKYRFYIHENKYDFEYVDIRISNGYIDQVILDITCGFIKVAFPQIKQFISMISDDWDYRDEDN